MQSTWKRRSEEKPENSLEVLLRKDVLLSSWDAMAVSMRLSMAFFPAKEEYRWASSLPVLAMTLRGIRSSCRTIPLLLSSAHLLVDSLMSMPVSSTENILPTPLAWDWMPILQLPQIK